MQSILTHFVHEFSHNVEVAVMKASDGETEELVWSETREIGEAAVARAFEQLIVGLTQTTHDFRNNSQLTSLQT